MNRLVKILTVVFMSLGLLTACGGGGSSIAPAASNLTGTAATGLPIAGFVFVKDARGTEINVATNPDGSFSINTAGLTPPLMVKIVPNNGTATLYSYAAALAQTLNISPFTNLALYIANTQADLALAYTNWNGTSISAANITNAQKVINANFATQFTAAGLTPTTYDFLTTAFIANGAGIDGVLDLLNFAFNYATGTFNITTKANGAAVAFNLNISTVGITIGGAGGGAGAAGGTLTITGDPLLPGTVAFVSAVFQSNAFSTDVTWTLTDLAAGTTLTVSVLLSHQGAPASAFPRVDLNYFTGGVPPTASSAWSSGTTQAAAGIVVDQQARTATFTNVQIVGLAPVVSTVTLNGTLSY